METNYMYPDDPDHEAWADDMEALGHDHYLLDDNDDNDG